jgi:DNA repair ATPase RecN
VSLVDITYRSEIDKLIECFEDTETKVKHLEQETFELAIPSINQLRYVAYHTLKAADANLSSIDDVRDEIKKALNHCQRAKFDAIEIWITYLLEDIRNFKETYSSVKETQDAIKDYIASLAEAQDAANELQVITDEQKSREEYYKKIEPHHQKLKVIAQKFREAEPVIATLVDENNKEKKKATRRFVIQTTIAVSGGLIALGMLANRLGII